MAWGPGGLVLASACWVSPQESSPAAKTPCDQHLLAGTTRDAAGSAGDGAKAAEWAGEPVTRRSNAGSHLWAGQGGLSPAPGQRRSEEFSVRSPGRNYPRFPEDGSRGFPSRRTRPSASNAPKRLPACQQFHTFSVPPSWGSSPPGVN